MYIKAKDIITGIVRAGAVPVLKSAGFKKSSLLFHRRREEVVQVVGFQLSQGNYADEGRFYVNVGIAFDKLWVLDQRPVLDRPKAHQCHRDWRLEELLPAARSDWRVSSTTDVDAVAQELSGHMTALVEQLNGIGSTDALLKRQWLTVGADLILRARLHYVAGDFEAALGHVRSAAEFFADRQGMSVAWIISDSNMTELERFV